MVLFHGGVKLFYSVYSVSCVNSLILFPNMIQRNLAHSSTSQSIMVAVYIDQMMLTGSEEQKVSSTLDALVKTI